MNTVREVIEKLQSFPEDARVILSRTQDKETVCDMEITAIYTDPHRKVVWVEVEEA